MMPKEIPKCYLIIQADGAIVHCLTLPGLRTVGRRGARVYWSGRTLSRTKATHAGLAEQRGAGLPGLRAGGRAAGRRRRRERVEERREEGGVREEERRKK